MSQAHPLRPQTARRILIVGDPLSTLKLQADSSLALAEAALQQGHCVDWCEPHQVALFGLEVVVFHPTVLKAVSVHGVSVGKETRRSELVALNAYDVVWVRKDPPFDTAYKSLCWRLASQSQVPVQNPAEVLLSFHEKALPFLARSEGVLKDYEVVPTCVTADPTLADVFLKDYARSAHALAPFQTESPLKWIVKPWHGFAGHGVKAFSHIDEIVAFLEQNSKGSGDEWMVQPFLPEIATQGDARVFIVEGEEVCSFVRFPAPGQTAANLAQGGTAQKAHFTEHQKSIISRICAWLKIKNIQIAGLDFIGNWVTEINITSPTGLRTYESLTGDNAAHTAVGLLLSRLSEK
jgi:glutathione synthase